MSTPDSIGSSRATGRVARVLKLVITTVLLVVALACGAWWLVKQKSEWRRAQWKSAALERLAKLSITNIESRQELDSLNGFGWVGDHVLRMTNGEHIIYEYRHGANGSFPPHLFLGHCSDGRWLYSTYHFCNSMNMVRSDDPPGSINEFAKKYFAREFDGKSDECLKVTW